MCKAAPLDNGLFFYKIKPLLLLVMFFSVFSSSESHSHSDSVSEYKIKAGFIYNFARFTQWPDKDKELRICIYGKDPFGYHIDQLESKTVSSKTISILRTNIIDNIKNCHIVFLNIKTPDQRKFNKVLGTIKGSSILTMSDTKNAINYGVMVGFEIKNKKMSFDINYTSILASGLKIKPQLIKLAKKVI